MKNLSKKAILSLCAVSLSFSAIAGNKDRSGQSGATELLLNPWGMSTGVSALNGANVRGLDAMKNNIAGLAFASSTEVGVAHSIYLRGSKVGINNIGLAQRLGDAGVLGVNVMSMGYGEIPITTYSNPGPGTPNEPANPLGTFKPQFFNIQAAFAKEFMNVIHAGIGVTFISEQITNVRASGACFEAGVQYVTGPRDKFHFGVTLRNVGTNMRFTGSGFTGDYESPEDDRYTNSRQTPTEKFELPAYLNIAAAYDFYLDENKLPGVDDTPKHRLTIMGGFTSHSFNNDQYGAAIEYAFRETFMLRGGYRHEDNIGDKELASTFYTGWSGGASVMAPLGKTGHRMGLDYSYRPTIRPSSGVHTFSIRLLLQSRKDGGSDNGNRGSNRGG